MLETLETMISTSPLVILTLFYLFAFIFPDLVSKESSLLTKWRHSDRLFFSSLLVLSTLPLLLLVFDNPALKAVVSVLCVVFFLVCHVFAEEKMYEELVPGYKADKDRLKQKRKLLREKKRSDEERQVAISHMKGQL